MTAAFLRDLLAGDGRARRHGVALNPALRVAMEAELRFPARSSGPAKQGAGSDTAALPENATPLPAATTRDRHRA